MKGTDVTPEQLAHAEMFLREVATSSPLPNGNVIVNVSKLIQLLAWYGAIRAKSGNVNPGRLISRTSETPSEALESGTL